MANHERGGTPLCNFEMRMANNAGAREHACTGDRPGANCPLQLQGGAPPLWPVIAVPAACLPVSPSTNMPTAASGTLRYLLSTIPTFVLAAADFGHWLSIIPQGYVANTAASTARLG